MDDVDHRRRRGVDLHVAQRDEADAAGHRRAGSRGCRRATPRRPTRPRSTCRSPSVRTPRDKVGITREDMDAWAYRSHMRAIAAIDEGRLQEEIFPIEVTLRDGTTKKFDTDEHPRRESTMEKLGSAQAAAPRDRGLHRHRRQRVGAQRRRRRGRARRQRLRGGARPRSRSPRSCSWASVGRRAARHGPRADHARSRRRSSRAGMTIDDVDLAEINEAFASVPRRRVPRSSGSPRRSRT